VHDDVGDLVANPDPARSSRPTVAEVLAASAGQRAQPAVALGERGPPDPALSSLLPRRAAIVIQPGIAALAPELDRIAAFDQKERGPETAVAETPLHQTGTAPFARPHDEYAKDDQEKRYAAGPLPSLCIE
jgi:hypothetical protein